MLWCRCKVYGSGVRDVDGSTCTHIQRRSWSSGQSCCCWAPPRRRWEKWRHRRRRGWRSSRTPARAAPCGTGAWVTPARARRRHRRCCHACGSSWSGSSPAPCSQGTLSCGRFEGSANEQNASFFQNYCSARHSRHFAEIINKKNQIVHFRMACTNYMDCESSGICKRFFN